MKLDPITLAVMNNRLAAIADEMGVVLGQTASRPTSRSGTIFRARFSTRAASWSRRPRTFRCISARRRSRCARRSRDLELGRGRRRRAERSVRRRNASAGPDAGRAGVYRRRNAARSRTPPTARITRISAGSRRARWRSRPKFTRKVFGLPPVKIVSGGEIARDVMTLFLANTRVREEREGDLRAQIAALSVGSERLLAMVKTSGRKTVEAAMDGLKDYAERLMIAALGELRPGTYRAEDFLDDDGFGTGPIPIRVAIKIGGRQGDRRFHRLRAAGARIGQRQFRDHAVGNFLRHEVPRGGGRARQRRPDASDQAGRAARLDRQRAGSGSGRGRQRRDLAANRRRAVSRAAPRRRRIAFRRRVRARCRI